MNIHQGLKEKNRLAGLIKQLDERIKGNTRWVKGNTPSYILKDLLSERESAIRNLNNLKVKISVATTPIVGKILEMAEKKSYVSVLKALDLSRGVDDSQHRRGYALTSATIEYDSAMTERERDKLVDQAQDEISTLQDVLDHFNATTEI